MRVLLVLLILCFAATAYAQINIPLGPDSNFNQTVPVFPNMSSFGPSVTGPSGPPPVTCGVGAVDLSTGCALPMLGGT